MGGNSACSYTFNVEWEVLAEAHSTGGGIIYYVNCTPPVDGSNLYLSCSYSSSNTTQGFHTGTIRSNTSASDQWNPVTVTLPGGNDSILTTYFHQQKPAATSYHHSSFLEGTFTPVAAAPL